MLVTAFKHRRKFITALYIDDEIVLIDTQTFIKSGLKVGSEIDEQNLSQLVEQSNDRRAFEKGMNFAFLSRPFKSRIKA